MNPAAQDQVPGDLTSPQADQQPQPGVDQPAPEGAQQQEPVSLDKAMDALRRQMTIDRKLHSIINKGGDIKRKDVLDLVTGFVADQAMTPQEGAGVLSDLPSDEGKLREWLENHARESDQAVQGLVQMIQSAQGPDQGGMPQGITEDHVQGLEALADHLESLPMKGGQPGAPPPPPAPPGTPSSPNPLLQ